MKILRQVSSVILLLVLLISTILNLLYLLNIVGWPAARLVFAIFWAVLFIISAMGLIIKDIKKEEVVSLNIITPVKEIGPPYVWALIVWFISCAAVFILRWHIIRDYTDW